MMHPYWNIVSQAIKVAIVGVSLPLLLSSAGLAQQNVQQDAVEVNPRIKESIKLLIDDNEDNDQEAIDKLTKNSDIVDLLIQEFNNNKNPVEVRLAIVKALGEVDHESERAVDQLIKIIEDQKEDDRIRIETTRKLVKTIKPSQKNIDKLINQLVNNQNTVSFREWSLFELGLGIASKNSTLNEQQIKQIISILNDEKNSEVYNQAIYLLAEAFKINCSSFSSFETIISEDNEDNNKKHWKTQIGLAQALGRSGCDVTSSMKVLIEFIKKNTSITQKEFALDSIQIIADELSRTASSIVDKEDQKKDWLKGLNLAAATLNNNNSYKSKNDKVLLTEKSLNNAINTINALQKPENTFWTLFNENKNLFIAIFLLSFWFSLLFLLLRLKPLSLLWLNSFLQKTDLSLEFIGVNFKTATLRTLLFDLQYHPRVLDDWVKTNLETARRQFENKQTVKQRNIYVPTIPVILNSDSIPELTPKDLQYKFSESRETLLIWGEGGSGKTALTCQLAK
ncbi:MAG: HEAT repeat domain-containing protein, partial [Planktothrix agardhii KL2]|nr:HEAT repeat domain-containing protein [Planktothrix agardhii KL2]